MDDLATVEKQLQDATRRAATMPMSDPEFISLDRSIPRLEQRVKELRNGSASTEAAPTTITAKEFDKVKKTVVEMLMELGRIVDDNAKKSRERDATLEKALKTAEENIEQRVSTEIIRAQRPLRAKITELEEKLAEVEGAKYLGVYQKAVTYAKGAAVTYDGSLWISLAANNTTDPGSGQWQLAAKRGRDGRDGR